MSKTKDVGNGYDLELDSGVLTIKSDDDDKTDTDLSGKSVELPENSNAAVTTDEKLTTYQIGDDASKLVTHLAVWQDGQHTLLE